MRQKNRLFLPVFYLMLVALCTVSGVAFYFDRLGFYIIACISCVTLLATGVYYLRRGREIDRFVHRVGEDIGHMQARTLVTLPLPVLVAGENGSLLWYNDCARAHLFPADDGYGRPITTLLGEHAFGEENGFSIRFGEHDYTVYMAHDGGAMPGEEQPREAGKLYVYYLCEDTRLKYEAAQYWATRPTMLMLMIDSLDEVLADARENERSQLMAQIEYIIEQYVGKYNGFVIKTDRDRFFAIIEERYMNEIVEKRFSLLDSVRSLANADRFAPTLSIGVARGVSSLPEGEQAARQALDMAQGRGGDQAAVKTPNGYDFYGGVSKGVEKRTKVKTRIVATALSELIASSSNVILMGHKYADLDSLGAAVGLLRPIRQMGKPAVVAINRAHNLVHTLLESLEKNGYEHTFYNPAELIERVTPETLLIVVDTHLEHVLESRELFHACKNVVVIDHHRRMVGYIDNAVIFYHEPYASSASEMVTELIQYFGERHRITRVEAEALLAGIMLDTRNFVLRTGVRTFEAAAYLRRLGADTVEVRKLFSSTMELYQSRTRVVASAEIHHRCAVAIVDSQAGDEVRLVAPQAADELLNISGVDASFVLYEADSGVSISARSMGKLNVQVIMEALGGGGHQTMAATQMPDTPMEVARQKLLETIEENVSRGAV